MAEKQVTIRRVRGGDAEDVARLISLLGYPCSPAQMQTRLAALAGDDNHATFVAEVDGAVGGMVGAFVCHIYEEDAPVGRILALSVSEELRGQSIGSQLLQEAECWLASLGVEAVLVNSGNHRRPAHRFYQTADYAVKGTAFVKRMAKP